MWQRRSIPSVVITYTVYCCYFSKKPEIQEIIKARWWSPILSEDEVGLKN